MATGSIPAASTKLDVNSLYVIPTFFLTVGHRVTSSAIKFVQVRLGRRPKKANGVSTLCGECCNVRFLSPCSDRDKGFLTDVAPTRTVDSMTVLVESLEGQGVAVLRSSAFDV
jgi:hypothetical protein